MKIARYFAIFILILSSTLSMASEKTESTIWIDVRTAEEYNEGYIPTAINIPYKEITERIEAIASSKDTEIHLYCGSGRRAGIAKAALEKIGYTNVINDGGYKETLERLKSESISQEK